MDHNGIGWGGKRKIPAPFGQAVVFGRGSVEVSKIKIFRRSGIFEERMGTTTDLTRDIRKLGTTTDCSREKLQIFSLQNCFSNSYSEKVLSTEGKPYSRKLSEITQSCYLLKVRKYLEDILEPSRRSRGTVNPKTLTSVKILQKTIRLADETVGFPAEARWDSLRQKHGFSCLDVPRHVCERGPSAVLGNVLH
jgi:hypothetical protein